MADEMTPVLIVSAAQQDAAASALTAAVAVQQAATALAFHGRQRPLRPVSSGIFGTPVYDRDANIAQGSTSPTFVPQGQPIVRPQVTQGVGPDINMHPRRIQLGSKLPIGRKGPEGQTVFSGPRNFQGMYGSSIFGGGISGLGATGGAVAQHKGSRYRRGGRISGLGDVDAKGYVMAPTLPGATTASDRCGFLGRMINWDGSWPCTRVTADAALQAQIAWWLANPANKAADVASNATPQGIPPYGKGAWITAMCSGMANVPPGFPKPSVCGGADTSAPALTPKPTMQTVNVGGSSLVGGAATQSAGVSGGGMSGKTLLIVGGLAAAGAAAFFLLKGKKGGAAPAAAA